MVVVEKAKISRKRSLQTIYYAPIDSLEPKKPVRIVSSLPSRLAYDKKATSKQLEESPQAFLMRLVESQDMKVHVRRFDEVPDLFETILPSEVDAYDSEALDAVRQRNIAKLQEFHQKGRPLKCSNRFGESLLHLGCRKAFCDVVEFLVLKGGVPVHVEDDFGRSPLHDACWSVKPDFALMDLLVDQAPDLLYVSDARGHTPLDYARREHWGQWVEYLQQKGDKLKPRVLTRDDAPTPVDPPAP